MTNTPKIYPLAHAFGPLESTASQARSLGLVVGDTIVGREEDGGEFLPGYWHEARLTLLWLGDEVAVWRATERSSERPEWSEPEECADWSLDGRQWVKVNPEAKP